MNFLRARGGVYELDKPNIDAPMRGRGMVWVPFILSVAWTVLFAWFVGRSIGWPVIPQLLPYEIGGMIAGFIAPPAAFFALAAMFANAVPHLPAHGQAARLGAVQKASLEHPR